jgi:hypothetical protein
LSSRDEIKEFKLLIEDIRKIGREKILERLDAMKNEEHVPTDILSTILKSWSKCLIYTNKDSLIQIIRNYIFKEDDDLDLESLTDDFITFLFAGQETIANTLTTLFLEIGKNKSIFMKAREEIDRVLGERNEITYQNAVDMKYCNSILKETLRLFPPVTMISREPTEDFFINEYKIPKGTFLVVIIILPI